MPKSIGTAGITERDNYFWLLVALMVLFFFSALFDQLGNYELRRLSGMLLTVVILVAVWSVEQGRMGKIMRNSISVLLVAVLGVEYLLEHYQLALLQLVTLLAFTLSTIYISCRQVLFSGNVDGNKIVGAICIYMFMGIAWALAYLLVEYVFPGSLRGLEGGDWRTHFQKALYFSFVSLTTLGYGDISPAQPLARYLATMQAVTGQFYIAILVASLIGVRLADRQQE